MIIRTGLTADEIRKIFQEVLEEFKGELLEELREDSAILSPGMPPMTKSYLLPKYAGDGAGAEQRRVN